MSREAQAVVLLLLGAALVHASLTDLYLRYVKAGLRPWLLAAGVVLVLVAIVTACFEWRRPPTTEPKPTQDPRRHQPGHPTANRGAPGCCCCPCSP